MLAQAQDFLNAFNTFDADGNGDLSVDELKLLLKALGVEMSDADTEDFLNEVDEDASGTHRWQGGTQRAECFAWHSNVRECCRCAHL